jgi:hypothetical protein
MIMMTTGNQWHLGLPCSRVSQECKSQTRKSRTLPSNQSFTMQHLVSDLVLKKNLTARGKPDWIWKKISKSSKERIRSCLITSFSQRSRQPSNSQPLDSIAKMSYMSSESRTLVRSADFLLTFSEY